MYQYRDGFKGYTQTLGRETYMCSQLPSNLVLNMKLQLSRILRMPIPSENKYKICIIFNFEFPEIIVLYIDTVKYSSLIPRNPLTTTSPGIYQQGKSLSYDISKIFHIVYRLHLNTFNVKPINRTYLVFSLQPKEERP